MFNPATVFDVVDTTDSEWISPAIQTSSTTNVVFGISLTDISSEGEALFTYHTEWSFDGEAWFSAGSNNTMTPNAFFENMATAAPLTRLRILLADGTTASFKVWVYLP